MTYTSPKKCHVRYADIAYWAEFAVNPIFKEVKKQCEKLVNAKVSASKKLNEVQNAAFDLNYFVQWNLDGSFEITPR